MKPSDLMYLLQVESETTLFLIGRIPFVLLVHDARSLLALGFVVAVQLQGLLPHDILVVLLRLKSL